LVSWNNGVLFGQVELVVDGLLVNHSTSEGPTSAATLEAKEEFASKQTPIKRWEKERQ
jgi:hypothetical protein